MRSLEEKMKLAPTVKSEAGEMMVIEVTHEGVTLAEACVWVEQLEYNVTTGGATVRLIVRNPKDPILSHTEYII